MHLSKILRVILWVNSKNFGKDKRVNAHKTVAWMSLKLYFAGFFHLCNCKELLLWLSIVPPQTYISSYVSTPGLSRCIASFVSINSFYLECQRHANEHGFKRLFGQLGMISFSSLIRIGLSWCFALKQAHSVFYSTSFVGLQYFRLLCKTKSVYILHVQGKMHKYKSWS